ncbi:MAG: fructose transport system permease protein [Gaiellales bacterium]|nr:fructose transport system permease protein [Gaiellales bacterium]MDX6580717.1 fructose transport system permease protein [Gaiellales bacterium]
MTTGDTTPADGTSGPSSLQTVRRLATAPTVGPFFALVLTMAFFTFETDRFLQLENLSLVLQQMMVVGVLAIGQTLVILTAGIDLSVGTVMALGQVVMTKLAIASGVPALPALLIGILTCVAFGVVNGGLITLVRLPAFIVTLGTLNIAFALTHIVSNDETYTGLPSVLLFFGRTFTVAGARFTYGVVFMLLLYAVVWYALSQTAWGRHIYAVGDNREAARLTGINTDRILLSVYTIAGLTSGLAAMLLVGRTEVGDPNAGQTTENLDSITAVVLGGTSLFGGRGTIVGTLIGAIIVGVFRNGLTLIGVQVIYQYLVTGALIILAVSVDQLTHRRRL